MPIAMPKRRRYSPTSRRRRARRRALQQRHAAPARRRRKPACRCDRRRHSRPCRRACSLVSRLSTRKASTTMSCVAEAVATSTAPSATKGSDAQRISKPRNMIATNEQQLREHQPAAAPAKRARQQWHVERIDQRRPQELERVGQADQRKQADGAEIDIALGHPYGKRRARQRQRQAGRSRAARRSAPAARDRRRARRRRTASARCRGRLSCALFHLSPRAGERSTGRAPKGEAGRVRGR